MAYTEGASRTTLTYGLIEALATQIQANAPFYTDENGNLVRVPIQFGYDEVPEAEYSTPSIIILNPNISKIREVLTHEPVYRDLDYEKLTAKEYPEPIPVRVRFKVHTATRNPDNDLRLLEYISQFYTTLSYVDCPLLKEEGQYDRYYVVWSEPTEFESTDISKVREIECDVYAWLEVLDYKVVRLLAPGDAVALVQEDFKDSIYHLKTYTALEVYKNDTEIIVTDHIKDFPVSGKAQIENDTFTYTSRTNKKFQGVSGITMFHNFNTEITYVES
jgi:hypothetical protein